MSNPTEKEVLNEIIEDIFAVKKKLYKEPHEIYEYTSISNLEKYLQIINSKRGKVEEADREIINSLYGYLKEKRVIFGGAVVGGITGAILGAIFFPLLGFITWITSVLLLSTIVTIVMILFSSLFISDIRLPMPRVIDNPTITLLIGMIVSIVLFFSGSVGQGIFIGAISGAIFGVIGVISEKEEFISREYAIKILIGIAVVIGIIIASLSNSIIVGLIVGILTTTVGVGIVYGIIWFGAKYGPVVGLKLGHRLCVLPENAGFIEELYSAQQERIDGAIDKYFNVLSTEEVTENLGFKDIYKTTRKLPDKKLEISWKFKLYDDFGRKNIVDVIFIRIKAGTNEVIKKLLKKHESLEYKLIPELGEYAHLYINKDNMDPFSKWCVLFNKNGLNVEIQLNYSILKRDSHKDLTVDDIINMSLLVYNRIEQTPHPPLFPEGRGLRRDMEKARADYQKIYDLKYGGM